MNIAELDLTLRSATDDSIVAELSLHDPAQSDQTTLVVSDPIILDGTALLAATLDAEVYGRILTQQLFADYRLRDAWNKMVGFSQGRNTPLRLRLRLDPAADHLHLLHWEKLYNPESDQPICLSEQLLFSRYVFGGDAGVAPLPQRSRLRALVAVASPANLATYNLDAIDAQAQIKFATDELDNVPTTTLGGAAGHRPASLASLGQALREGTSIIYLVCHGRLIDGTPRLYLERDDLNSDIVSGQQLVHLIKRLAPAQRPSLVILAVCHSGGDDDPAAIAGTLGPQLVRAGVRAVIGMHGRAPVELVEQMIPVLFKRLLADGLVDQALAAARATLPEHKRLPWWTPVLFMRATDGRVWAPDGSVEPGLPFQQPRVPDTYVPRPEAENSILQMIVAPAGAPVTVLYGMSGIGKTSLAARVAQRLEADRSMAGVLWGSLDHLTPNDQLLQFLGALQPHWYQHQISMSLVLRDVFWSQLKQSGSSVLIVCDQVSDAQQLAELLPSNPGHMGRSRVLALSVRRLTIPGLEDIVTNIELGGLAPAETLDLFARLSSSAWVAQHRSALREIGRYLEHVPQLLVLAARDMLAGSISPASFLQRLAEGRREHRLLNASVTTALELAIRDLTSAQIALLEFTGILGDGNWNYRMLAAVALRGPEEIRQDLVRLVERDLVRQVGPHRYRANTLVREFALNRLSRQPAYAQVAAATLLARHCLDLAQDAYVLATRSLRTGAAADGGAELTDEAVKVFRNTLRPELSHLRRALHWAVDQEAWNLLLRFAYVPALELLTHLVTNRDEVRMALTMPTIIEPVTRSTEQTPFSSYASFITSADWSLTRLQDASISVIEDSRKSESAKNQRTTPGMRQRCELIWNITAGHIVDGVFIDTSLVDSSWKGVRAPRLVCRGVDIVGSQLLACDLSESVLFDCDARQVQLLGTILQEALLVDVRLHGADLRGINANGAILEGVDMRGVDLRDATLIGTTLEDVDLRGADLRAANLAGAKLRNVNLNGSQLQSVTWSGAELDEATKASVEDIAHWRVIEASCAESLDSHTRLPIHLSRPREFIPDPLTHVIVLVDQDVRARRLGRQNFANAILSRTDFRATDFGNAHLEGIVADGINGRGISFKEAELERAQLVGADLRAANLARANLAGANLERANLRSASAWHASIAAANLRGADLRYADLSRADLRKVDLTGADLRGANLTAVSLEGAILSGANLSEANFRQARLRGADLNGACGSHTNFEGAQIDELQLTSIGALGGATLPAGNVVPLFRDRFEASLPETPEQRFAQWSGEFVACELRGLSLFGTCLDGRFVYCPLDGAILERAHLVGIFVGCTFTNANLVGARLSGIFYEVDFTGSILAEASLSGASFVNCNMIGAKVNNSQLQVAARLRGTKLDFGRYDGRFSLSGDIEDAGRAGLDPADAEVMRDQFYNLDSVRFSPY